MLNNAAETRDTFNTAPPPNPGTVAVETARDNIAEALLHQTDPVPWNDLEAARLVARHCRTEDVWLSHRATGKSSGEWLAWDGTVHVTVPDELDYHLATGLVDAIDLVVEQTKSLSKEHPRRKAAVEGRKRWSSRTGLGHVRSLVRSELRVAQDHFDRERRWLPMSDGRLLDLTELDADLRQPDPRNPVTRKLGTTIWWEEDRDPIRFPKRWAAWLDRFVPDKGEQAFLQEAAGAALLGRGDAKAIIHLVGRRHTGKTTYLNIMSMAFGMPDQNGFSGDLANGAIVAKYGGSTNFNQASAKGVRFLTLSEPSTQQTDDSFLKSISGSRDPIRTEKKGQNEERWYAECVLHIAANQVVRFNTRDKAVVDRVHIVEFASVVEPDEDDTDFEAKLFAEEGDGILCWVIEGAKRYAEKGIIVPETVRARAQANVIHESSVLRWLTQRIDEKRYEIKTAVPMNHMIEPKVGYTDYMNWVRDEGGVKNYATQRQWLDEIQTYTQVPADKTDSRSGGKARVWGVVEAELPDLLTGATAGAPGALTVRPDIAMPPVEY